MHLIVKLFGPQAAAADTQQIELELDGDDVRSAELRAALAKACPTIAATIPGSRLAVNHQLVCDQHVIRHGDEVALIGMVSGG